MNETFYYVVTPEFEEIDEGVFELTGNKDVDIYKIIDNKPIRLQSLTIDTGENSEEAIYEFFEQTEPDLIQENGEAKYTLTQL